MDNFKIHFLKDIFDIAIDNFKIIIGDNYITKYEIIRTINQYFEKKNYSEYQNINNNKCYIEYNEKRMDTKEWELFIVSCSFDLNNDIKLGSKSILYKYFEVILRDIEYSDSVNTINLLMDDLKEEIINDRIEKIESEIELLVSLQDLNYKSIIKLLELGILKEGIEANAYDMSYEQLIMFQLDIIKQISNKIKNKKLIVIVDIPLLTSSIMQTTASIENAKVLVFTEIFYKKTLPPLESICYINNTITDIASDNNIYNNILMDLPFNMTIDDFKQEILNILTNNFTDKTQYLINIL